MLCEKNRRCLILHLVSSVDDNTYQRKKIAVLFYAYKRSLTAIQKEEPMWWQQVSALAI